MEAERVTQGHCKCGAVTYRYTGPENWRGHCHCEDCRRATSSPFTSYLGVPRDRFEWTGEEPKTYQSSPGVTRYFCPACGSPMGFEAPQRFGPEIHLFAATLDDSDNYIPQFHVYCREMVRWVCPADGLPKYSTTVRGGEE
ncbi:MAG: GFA family protein [Paracoccaceae bacterium]